MKEWKKGFFMCMLLHQLLQQPIDFFIDFGSFSYYPARRFGCLTWGNEIFLESFSLSPPKLCRENLYDS